jgi:hypothetical protein
MKRTIIVQVEIDWEDYDDVCDELMLEDSGIYDSLKDGVEIKLINPNK